MKYAVSISKIMKGFMPLQIGIGSGELLLIGFLIFIIVYILIRILTEKYEHSRFKMKDKKNEKEKRR